MKTFQKPSCYTDSKIVLYWIKGHTKEWKQFVQNRVVEIRKLLPVDCWNHCPGAENPADLPSHGADVSELVSSSVWMYGRKWLSEADNIRRHNTVEEPIPEECLRSWAEKQCV